MTTSTADALVAAVREMLAARASAPLQPDHARDFAERREEAAVDALAAIVGRPRCLCGGEWPEGAPRCLACGHPDGEGHSAPDCNLCFLRLHEAP